MQFWALVGAYHRWPFFWMSQKITILPHFGWRLQGKESLALQQ